MSTVKFTALATVTVAAVAMVSISSSGTTRNRVHLFRNLTYNYKPVGSKQSEAYGVDFLGNN